MALSERLAILITADGKGAVRELKSVGSAAERDIGKATTSLDKFSAQSAKLGTGLLVGAGIALPILGRLGQAASALNEQVAGSDVIFRSNAAQVEAWSGSLAGSFGLSSTAALTAANNFGALFKGSGSTDDEAAQFSTTLVQLAGDLSSFKNIASEDVLGALRSGLSGEAEPLRRLDVFLTEAKVKAKAAELGLTGLNGELSEGAKVQARYALILEETGLAQGDFARTSDSLANTQRAAAANAENAGAAVGQGIVGPYTLATDAVNSLFVALNNADPALASSVGTFASVGTAAATAVGGLALLASGVVRARGAFTDATGAVNNFGRAAGALGAVAGIAAAAVSIDALHKSLTDIKQDLADLATLDGKELIGGFQAAANKKSAGAFSLDPSVLKERITGNATGLTDFEQDTQAFQELAETNIANAQRLIDALNSYGQDTTLFQGILEKEIDLQRQLGADGRQAGDILGGLGGAAEGAGGGFGILGQGIAGAGSAIGEAVGNFGTLESSVENLREALFGVPQAQLGVERAFLSLEDAQAGVVDAERELAQARKGSDGDSKAQERSLRSVADAQKELGRANEGVLESEEELHDARLSFADDLLDLELAAEDASLSLSEAQEDERNTAGDFSATPNEVRRASLRRRQAERDLGDANEELSNVRSTGKTDAIRTAEDGLTSAIETQRGAQERLTEAASAHNDLLSEQRGRTDGVAEAQRNLERAQLAVKEAELAALGATFDLEQAQQTLTEQTGFQNEASDKLILDLKEMQERYPLLADEIQKYIDKLLQIPTYVSTVIGLQFEQGVADVGSALSSIGAGLTAAASTTVTQNVYPSEGMSERELADIAARQLGWQTSINGRN